jgi:beta-galactosidase
MNLESYLSEAAILRELTPKIPVTTNFHGLQKGLDYFTWARHIDIIAWDSYPRQNMHPANIAFYQDLMRGMMPEQPWLLMEQTPSQVQWHPDNGLKRPGVMRLQCYQAIAHGANAALFFQWRQSRGGEEMYHGALVSHVGHEQTRVFQEIASLGAELQKLDPSLLTTTVQPRIALLMSWENWWTIENEHVPSQRFDYLAELQLYHQALWKHNMPVDIISPNARLENYTLILAPLLTMVSEEQGRRIERYVEQGGTFVTSYFSGMVDENNRAWLGGYPGPLRQTLGIWVEEFDPLPVGKTNTLLSTQEMDGWEGSYRCDFWCEVLHLEGAHALSTFGEDFYAGRPAITENEFGEGRAFYIATRPEAACLDNLLALLEMQLGLSAPLEVPNGVEVIQRQSEQASYIFLLNHQQHAQMVTLPQPMRDVLTQQIYEQNVLLPAVGVVILIPLTEIDE